MGSPIYKWVVVFDDDIIVTYEGETIANIIDDFSWEELQSIVAIFKKGSVW